MVFRTFNSYLKAAYHTEVGKICIDGGFTCPNRDGTKGVGGCIFCGERGAGEHLCAAMSVREQVEDYFRRPHRQKKFVAYFQNFTNTYASPDVLMRRYTDALIDPRIVALAIGTRPDCLGEDVLDVLSAIKERIDLWVELGLQTTNDDTARRIRRGYATEEYLRACERLRARGIPFAVHLMIGLPGEGTDELRATVDTVARTHPFGVKLHGVYVMDGTDLQADYLAGRYTPIEKDAYIEAVIDTLLRLPPDTVILRLMSDCPPGRLVAPAWNTDKAEVHAEIRRRMAERGLTQGMLFTP